jgi:hypothetical protein
MKKGLSILFAVLILVSGMHFSIAKHICGGEVAGIKWSFSGKIADCGMENNKSTCPSPGGFASNCCQNEIAYYAVDGNYYPTFNQSKEVTKSLLQVLFIPLSSTVTSLFNNSPLYANVSPPDNSLASSVSLAGICILRI